MTLEKLLSFIIDERTRSNIVVGVVLLLIALLLGIAQRAFLIVETGLIQLLLILRHRCSFGWV